jgi:hypothetical protein
MYCLNANVLDKVANGSGNTFDNVGAGVPADHFTFGSTIYPRRHPQLSSSKSYA